jgi:hypothetical protein
MADLNRLAKGTDPVNTSVVVMDEKQKEREQKEEAPTRSPSCGGCSAVRQHDNADLSELGRHQWSSRGYKVMSQKDVEVLRKARDRLVEDRRGLAEALAKPYDRGNTENWRVHLVEVQQTIAAVDEAIKEEELYG